MFMDRKAYYYKDIPSLQPDNVDILIKIPTGSLNPQADFYIGRAKSQDLSRTLLKNN